MFDPFHQPPPIHRLPPAPGQVETVASSPGFDDDLALGCESADPYLQIERWRQEALPLRPAPEAARRKL